MSIQKSENQLFTLTQVERYFSRIEFPASKWPKITSAAAQTNDGLVYLTSLQKHHLTGIPFENTSLHYAKFPGISLDKDDIFEKMVELRKGGYCMEHNILFATILRTLGYEVIQSGARVFGPSGDFGPWDHQVNFVVISSQVYVVDVGFGGQGPTRPLLLADGLVSKWGATDAEMRLSFQKPKSPFVQGLWLYEHRISNTAEWKPAYCFGMTEFFQEDFEAMSYAVSTRRDFFFTQEIICMRMICDGGVDDISGIVSLSGKTLKKRIQAHSKVIAECLNEDDRINILKGYFGIDLSAKERAGIKGTVAEIK